MKRVICISSILIAITLMILPSGISMTFTPSPTESITKHFSYFSMMPLGHGNWFPIITALLSIITFLLLITGTKKVNINKAVKILLSTCIAASALSWIIFNSFSAISICIMILHISVLWNMIDRNYWE